MTARPIAIVLAMHGAPPRDFPRRELQEFMGLHGRLEHAAGPEREALQRRHDELEAKMRSWPRTPENDLFHAASLQLAEHLGKATGLPVIVGFNEFCAPALDEALDQAASSASHVVVVTPMMTRGGTHAEADIPREIDAARARHPTVRFTYAWPFPMPDIAGFLAGQIQRHLQEQEP
jgi:sirohydrochlorin cobaltochelatase